MWTLGDRLAKARRMADLSVQDMADALGVSRNTVTNYERGHTDPARGVLIAYASVTGVPMWWIEGLDENLDPSPRWYPEPQAAA